MIEDAYELNAYDVDAFVRTNPSLDGNMFFIFIYFLHVKSIYYLTWVSAQDLNSSTILSQHINLNNFKTSRF